MPIEVLILLSAVLLVSGVVATVFFYVSFLRASHEAMPSFIRYFVTAVALAFAAYFVGSAVGIYGACRSPDSGNLCGIWGALGTGPLLSGIALWSYGFLWRRRLAK